MTSRFVILEHTYQGVHYDLMLELGDVLRTWRLETPPEPGRTVGAEPLPDHRLLYLDYEGPISGDRCSVRRWDAGTYTGDASGSNHVCVELHGERLCGRLELRLVEQQHWECVYRLEGA